MNLQLNGKPQIFADDLAIKYESQNIDSLYNKMQQHLDVYTIKSKYIVFKILDQSLLQNKIATYNTVVLERVEEYKYLGLIIQSNFKWEKHIDLIKRKIVPYIFSLRKLNLNKNCTAY